MVRDFAVLTCCLVLSTAAWADSTVAEQVADSLAVAEWPDPGSDAWDAQASRWLLTRRDQDRSGDLDDGEVAEVPCVAWAALDQAVRARWGSGLWTVYGVDERRDDAFEGLGIRSTAGPALSTALEACGLGEERFGLRAGRDVAAQLFAVPGQGDAAWDLAVRRVMVTAHDTDQDGVLGADAEVEAVSCAAWHVLDARVRHRWSQGMYLTYGMADGLVWVGDALGLSSSARDAVNAALVACDVPGAGAAAPLPSSPAEVAMVVGLLPEPGGDAWIDLVRALLLHVFDQDGSGDLAATGEVRAIDCEVWRAMDDALAPAGGVDAVFGFGGDGRWSGWRLGFEGSARAMASDVLGACLAQEEPAAAGEASPAGAPDLVTWDADGGGRIDRPREVRAVPCVAWQAWAIQARRDRRLSLADAWGLRRGMVWAAEEAALDETVRGPVRRALRRCRVDEPAGVAAPRGLTPGGG